MAIQWSLVLFSLLAGSGGILLAFTGIGEYMGLGQKVRTRALIIAIALLIVGGCASVLHLAQPANIMAAAANIGSFSGISVELIALGYCVIVSLIYLLLASREGSEGALKALGALGILGGVVIAFVTGNGYVMQAQPAWNTFTLPLAYLGTALATGASLYLALMVSDGADDADIEKLKPMVLGCAGVGLVTVLAYGFLGNLIGDVAWFWGCAVVVGGIGALIGANMISKNKSMAYVALVCAFVGGLGIRCAMWVAGSGYLDFFKDAAGRIVLGL